MSAKLIVNICNEKPHTQKWQKSFESYWSKHKNNGYLELKLLLDKMTLQISVLNIQLINVKTACHRETTREGEVERERKRAW